MRTQGTHVAGWLAVAVAACASAAQATVLVPGTLADLVRDAQVIVRGRVSGVYPQFADGRRRIETVVVIDADGYLKGDFGEQFVFKVPGGEIGRYRNVMVGAPVFRAGDDVVLFLSSQGPELPHLVGFSQGVLRLVPEAGTGRALVLSPPLDSIGPKPRLVVRGDRARRSIPYEDFAARVRVLTTPRGGATLRAPADERPPVDKLRAIPRPTKKDQVRVP